MDGEKRTDSAFFAINSLHYCAAVRYVNMGGFAVEGGGERFIPLDSPFAQTDSPHPPIFAAIFRRTTGVKVDLITFFCRKFLYDRIALCPKNVKIDHFVTKGKFGHLVTEGNFSHFATEGKIYHFVTKGKSGHFVTKEKFGHFVTKNKTNQSTILKVLECHGFVCTNEKAANALVRCCFHAYADTVKT